MHPIHHSPRPREHLFLVRTCAIPAAIEMRGVITVANPSAVRGGVQSRDEEETDTKQQERSQGR